ncbi:hypothetical protein BT69DRAFT_765329 [Atractiella rhizophila]|nr:hypothetical protein BT69DRAFT_765329 [Atractiella rhizophila]
MFVLNRSTVKSGINIRPVRSSEWPTLSSKVVLEIAARIRHLRPQVDKAISLHQQMEVVFTESDFNVRGRYEQRALEILQERPSRPYLVEGLESRIPKGLNNAPPSHEELRKFISDHHLTDEEYTTFEMPELRELKRLLQDILKLQKVWYDFKAEQREKEAQTDGGNPNRPNHMTSPNYFPSPTFDVPRTPWMRVQPPYHTPYTPPRPAFQSSGQRRNTLASTSPHSGTRGTPPSANISQNSQSPYGRDNGFFSPSDPLETSPPRQTGIYSSPNQPHRYSPPRQPGMYSPPRQAGMYSPPRQPGMYSPPRQAGMYSPPRQTGMYSPNSSPGERHYQQNNSPPFDANMDNNDHLYEHDSGYAGSAPQYGHFQAFRSDIPAHTYYDEGESEFLQRHSSLFPQNNYDRMPAGHS